MYIHPVTAEGEYKKIQSTNNFSFHQIKKKARKVLNPTFSYFYGNILAIEQSPPLPLSYQLKQMENTSWLTISFDIIVFPIFLSVLALEIPARMDGIDILPPPYFIPTSLPDHSYDSWITAELFYMNCSEMEHKHTFAMSVSSHLNGIPLEKICQYEKKMSLSPMPHFKFIIPPTIFFKET